MPARHALKLVESDASEEPGRYRDPTAERREARELCLAIARLLVKAPALPVALPLFELELIDVEAEPGRIHLVLGSPDRVASLAVREDTARGVRVDVELEHAAAPLARRLATMAERVRRSLGPKQVAEAAALARRLRALPVKVPLGFFRQLVQGVEPKVALVRTGFLCNQNCGMCWQDRDWGRYPSAQLTTWLEDLYREGARSLIVSGGEPTLDKDLARHIAFARELGFAQVTLETNAIRLGQPGYAETLLAAGLSGCFVSLHSADPSVSDAITRAPGTHEKTVAGVLRLLELGVPVKLNAVLSAEGLESMPGLPDFVATTFGPRIQSLMISFPSDPFERELAARIVPDPASLRRVLPAVVTRARALGLSLEGLNGPCGPPVCALGSPLPLTLAPVQGGVDFRVHLPPCDGCGARPLCFGIPRGQAERFGNACAAPLPG
ncbi:MAG TPA: radical SAM protein [Polyangiaceae bacterium]